MEMMDKLFKEHKITPKEYKLYCLFHLSESGREFLDDMVKKTFMEEPTPDEFNTVGFAWYDGRRSIARNLIRTIEKVITILKEENYVGQSEPTE